MTVQNRRKGNQRGFTLIEVMIVMGIMVAAILAVIEANVAIQRNSEMFFEKTVALQHAQRLMEQMRVTASTAGGTFPSNLVNNFPNNTVYRSTMSAYAWLGLSSETMTLSYANTASDPLDVSITVAWLTPQNRNGTATLRSLITKRT
jgi:prepilin-type N-terminal cleavage/methylation domain-containing protein